jgi:hypothetical protein
MEYQGYKTREEMFSLVENAFPYSGVRYLHSELSNLSPKGIVWLLPSLLRQEILTEQRFDSLHELLIYDLEFDEDRFDDVRERYSLLGSEQIECMACALEYFSEIHGHCFGFENFRAVK